MLGDILGSSAGDTCTEPVDCFRPVRGVMVAGFRAVGPVEPGRICGLWLVEAVPGRLSDGDGSGFEEANFAELASIRGVDALDAGLESMGPNRCDPETDSGNAKDSMFSLAV